MVSAVASSASSCGSAGMARVSACWAIPTASEISASRLVPDAEDAFVAALSAASRASLLVSVASMMAGAARSLSCFSAS